MEKQVLSVSQMEELINLGIDTSKASMCWWKHNNWIELKAYSFNELTRNGEIKEIQSHLIPTFTLQDILEILPQGFYLEKNTTSLDKKAFLQINKTADGGYNIAYEQSWDENGKLKMKMHGQQLNKSLLQAVFNMLKWCKQNNYI